MTPSIVTPRSTRRRHPKAVIPEQQEHEEERTVLVTVWWRTSKDMDGEVSVRSVGLRGDGSAAMAQDGCLTSMASEPSSPSSLTLSSSELSSASEPSRHTNTIHNNNNNNNNNNYNNPLHPSSLQDPSSPHYHHYHHHPYNNNTAPFLQVPSPSFPGHPNRSSTLLIHPHRIPQHIVAVAFLLESREFESVLECGVSLHISSSSSSSSPSPSSPVNQNHNTHPSSSPHLSFDTIAVHGRHAAFLVGVLYRTRHSHRPFSFRCLIQPLHGRSLPQQLPGILSGVGRAVKHLRYLVPSSSSSSSSANNNTYTHNTAASISDSQGPTASINGTTKDDYHHHHHHHHHHHDHQEHPSDTSHPSHPAPRQRRRHRREDSRLGLHLIPGVDQLWSQGRKHMNNNTHDNSRFHEPSPSSSSSPSPAAPSSSSLPSPSPSPSPVTSPRGAANVPATASGPVRITITYHVPRATRIARARRLIEERARWYGTREREDTWEDGWDDDLPWNHNNNDDDDNNYDNDDDQYNDVHDPTIDLINSKNNNNYTRDGTNEHITINDNDNDNDDDDDLETGLDASALIVHHYNDDDNGDIKNYNHRDHAAVETVYFAMMEDSSGAVSHSSADNETIDVSRGMESLTADLPRLPSSAVAVFFALSVRRQHHVFEDIDPSPSITVRHLHPEATILNTSLHPLPQRRARHFIVCGFVRQGERWVFMAVSEHVTERYGTPIRSLQRALEPRVRELCRMMRYVDQDDYMNYSNNNNNDYDDDNNNDDNNTIAHGIRGDNTSIHNSNNNDIKNNDDVNNSEELIPQQESFSSSYSSVSPATSPSYSSSYLPPSPSLSSSSSSRHIHSRADPVNHHTSYSHGSAPSSIHNNPYDSSSNELSSKDYNHEPEQLSHLASEISELEKRKEQLRQEVAALEVQRHQQHPSSPSSSSPVRSSSSSSPKNSRRTRSSLSRLRRLRSFRREDNNNSADVFTDDHSSSGASPPLRSRSIAERTSRRSFLGSLHSIFKNKEQ